MRLRQLVQASGSIAIALTCAASMAAADGASEYSGRHVALSIDFSIADSGWQGPTNPTRTEIGEDTGIGLSIQGGYDWGITPDMIAGIEVGFLSHLGDDEGLLCRTARGEPAGNATRICAAEATNIFSVGGRIGYVIDSTLLYGSGGYANAEINTRTYNPPGSPTINPEIASSERHSGYYIGLGVERIVTEQFRLFGEVTFFDFIEQDHTLPTANLSSSTTRDDVSFSAATFSFGIAYRF